MVVRRCRSTLLGSALAFALAACGNASEKVAENLLERGGINADVSVDRDGALSAQADGTSINTSTRLPDSWPNDIPIPEYEPRGVVGFA